MVCLTVFTVGFFFEMELRDRGVARGGHMYSRAPNWEGLRGAKKMMQIVELNSFIHIKKKKKKGPKYSSYASDKGWYTYHSPSPDPGVVGWTSLL